MPVTPWRRIRTIAGTIILTGSGLGCGYAAMHYLKEGSLPKLELPQWAQPLLLQLQLQRPTVTPHNQQQQQQQRAAVAVAKATADEEHRKLEESFSARKKALEEEQQQKQRKLAAEEDKQKKAAVDEQRQRKTANDGPKTLADLPLWAQQLVERKVTQAVEEQRKLDESLSKMTLELERRRIQDKTTESSRDDDLNADFERARKEWEAELGVQLKRAAIAHAEQLEKVIKMQKQIHDVESKQLVEEAISIERQKLGKKIDNTISQLGAIEEALKGRAALDMENRRAKIYWTICQSLMKTIVSGGDPAATKDGRQKVPYKISLKEIALLKHLAKNDTFAQSVCAQFPADAIGQGVPTEQGLVKRFNKVYTLARRTAQIGDEGGSMLRYIASWLQSLVTLELPAAYSADDRIDVSRYEPYELLARCRHFVESRDLLNAVRVANLIRGESARIFADWLSDVNRHLEARMLVELLFAHAEASGIRTIY